MTTAAQTKKSAAPAAPQTLLADEAEQAMDQAQAALDNLEQRVRRGDRGVTAQDIAEARNALQFAELTLDAAIEREDAEADEAERQAHAAAVAASDQAVNDLLAGPVTEARAAYAAAVEALRHLAGALVPLREGVQQVRAAAERISGRGNVSDARPAVKLHLTGGFTLDTGETMPTWTDEEWAAQAIEAAFGGRPSPTLHLLLDGQAAEATQEYLDEQERKEAVAEAKRRRDLLERDPLGRRPADNPMDRVRFTGYANGGEVVTKIDPGPARGKPVNPPEGGLDS